ncbi:MAG: hypothetical protein H7Y14_04560 [Burkholderiales bacterium]|nr:hypothetical protein [Burkholderiales bacterium]
MLRTLAIVVLLLAGGCATPRGDVSRLASAEPSQASVELECMGDCLDEPDVNCDDCALRCFKAEPGFTITFAR